MKTKVFVTLFVLLLIGASLGTAYYFYDKYQDAQAKLANPDLIAQDEVKVIVDKLGKLIELPADENPTLATVLEKDKLKDQPFFARAENGDKVVLFTQAQKAILYRESTNKIIEVAPISISQPEQETEGSPAPVTPATSPAPLNDSQ